MPDLLPPNTGGDRHALSTTILQGFALVVATALVFAVTPVNLSADSVARYGLHVALPALFLARSIVVCARWNHPSRRIALFDERLGGVMLGALFHLIGLIVAGPWGLLFVASGLVWMSASMAPATLVDLARRRIVRLPLGWQLPLPSRSLQADEMRGLGVTPTLFIGGGGPARAVWDLTALSRDGKHRIVVERTAEGDEARLRSLAAALGVPVIVLPQE